MGDVAMIYSVMPENPDVDLEKIKGEIKSAAESVGAELNRADIKPIAFGLKALEIVIVMDDKSGKSGELEEKMKAIEGVQNIELTDMSLI